MKKETIKFEVIWPTVVAILVTVFSTITIGGFITTKDIDNHEYVEKTGLKNKLSKIIYNGGGLDVVKYAYDSRTIEHYTSDHFLPMVYYENEGLTLMGVLNDLLVDFYCDSLSKSSLDSLYLERLRSTCDEYSRNNPFDELEKDQSVLFQNVQVKLANNYELVKDDMLLISDALKDKNSLTEEYLKKSNLSFWISIGAVIITLFLGLIQIFQNFFKKKKDEENHRQILEELKNKDD